MRRVASSNDSSTNPIENIEPEETDSMAMDDSIHIRRLKRAVICGPLATLVLFAALAMFLFIWPNPPFPISTSSTPEIAVPDSYDFQDLTHEENLLVYRFVKEGVILLESPANFNRDAKLYGWELKNMLYWLIEFIGNENIREPNTGIPDCATVSCEDTYQTLRQYARYSLIEDENVPSVDDIRDALKAAVDDDDWATTDDITILQAIVMADMMFGILG